MNMKKNYYVAKRLAVLSGRSIVWLVHWPSKPVTRVQIPATAFFVIYQETIPTETRYWISFVKVLSSINPSYHQLALFLNHSGILLGPLFPVSECETMPS